MAKKLTTSTDGAAAAAHDGIEDIILKLPKYHDTIKRARQEAEENAQEAIDALSQAVAGHIAEMSRQKETFQKMIDEWKARAIKAEDVIGAVRGKLS